MNFAALENTLRRRQRQICHNQHILTSPDKSSLALLLKMRDQYILQFSEKRKPTTLSKTNKAVEVLLSHLRKRDIPLKDINRTIVTGWLDKLKSEKAPQTIQKH